MIEAPHLDKVLGYIASGREQGARVVVGGGRAMPDSGGYFVEPTVFDGVDNSMTIARDEIFGPVASVSPAGDLAGALEVMRAHPNANAASIFTSSGKAAREFAHRASSSMVGVNVGVAAPMAYFPFGGAKDSFFGDLKVHGRDAFEFYTDKKVVTSRWY
jgi:malonate-semialdehyde dehydrogenase (acetylating)/methylmalonate-semialdehyde dehydrogenase